MGLNGGGRRRRIGCLGMAFALAMLLPMEQVRRQLRPLAEHCRV